MRRRLVWPLLVVLASLFVTAAGCNSRQNMSPGAGAGAGALTGAGAGASASTRHIVSPIDDRETLSFLASDELEGRGIGTHGLERAAGYIAGEFAQLGLRPLAGQGDFFQPFEMTTATEIG